MRKTATWIQQNCRFAQRSKLAHTSTWLKQNCKFAQANQNARTAMLPLPMTRPSPSGRQVPFTMDEQVVREIVNSVIEDFGHAAQFSVHQVEVGIDKVWDRHQQRPLPYNSMAKRQLIKQVLEILEAQRDRQSDPTINRPAWAER